MSGAKECIDEFSDDLLAGVSEISNWLYGNDAEKERRRVYYLLEMGHLPGFKLGGRWHLRKSTAVAHIERCERAAANGLMSLPCRALTPPSIVYALPANTSTSVGICPPFDTSPRRRVRVERKIAEEGKEILTRLQEQNVGPAESRVLQAILTGEDVSDADMQTLAVPIRQAIDEMGEEAVQLGLLSRESYERNRGAYLHRVYMKHEADQNRLSRWVGQAMGRKRKQIIGDQFRGRGLFLDVEMPRLMRNAPGFQEGTRGRAVKGDRFLMLDRVSPRAGNARGHCAGAGAGPASGLLAGG